MSRPEKLVVVLGTGTGVGKTFVTLALVRLLRANGRQAVARKPVQSFSAEETNATDAHVLAEAGAEQPDDVCPPHRWYPVAMAPPMAAERLGMDSFVVADLAAETRWPPGTAISLVETVGGVRSPAAADGDSLALATAFAPDAALLVADAGLGVINAVRLCVPPLATLPCPVHVFLNRYDPADDLHCSNLAVLTADGYQPTTEVESLATRITPLRIA